MANGRGGLRQSPGLRGGGTCIAARGRRPALQFDRAAASAVHPVGAVRILVDGTAYTPYDAKAQNLVDNRIWIWNGSAYDVYDDQTPGMLGTLEPQKAYWVKVLSGAGGKTVKLVIPYGGAVQSPPGTP